MSDVERIRSRYEAGGQLKIIGMNLDKTASTALGYLQRRPLQWSQGLLGDWADTPIPGQFGISSVPAYVLIAPDGSLLKKTSDLGQMEQFIRTTIKKPNALRRTNE